jgi:hypothetical protein
VGSNYVQHEALPILYQKLGAKDVSLLKKSKLKNAYIDGNKIAQSGTDVLIFKIFSPKNSAKKFRF